jgi:hypothetical protein
MLSLRSILSRQNKPVNGDKMLRKLSMTGGVLLLPYPLFASCRFRRQGREPSRRLAVVRRLLVGVDVFYEGRLVE